MKKLLVSVALVLLLGGCSTLTTVSNASSTTVSPTVIAQARNTVLAIDNLYGVAVVSADTWAKQPRCGSAGAAPSPLCSTASGTITLNKAAVAMRKSLNEAETLVMKANPQQSELDLAIATGQAAWVAYQGVLAAYSIKTN